MFWNCSKLSSVTIPDSVTEICYEAFYSCNSLTEITIPDSVTKLDDAAFLCCGLTSVTVPESVESIGNYTFYCEDLEEITILNPDCIIYDTTNTITDTSRKGFKGKIYGRDDSTAQAYAKKYKYKFVSLDSASGGDFPVIPVVSGILGVSAASAAVAFAVSIIYNKKKR